MPNRSTNPKTAQTFEVTLDGQRVEISPSRRSLGAIRFYLETIAMEQQRVLSSFKIDGRATNSARLDAEFTSFSHIDAETTELNNRPSQILGTALLQIANARALVETAVTQVLINDAPLCREIWWDLARRLKEPLLILGMLPDSMGWQAQGCAPLNTVRKWQLEQLAAILRDVDEACWGKEMSALSNALENRALAWLDSLERTVTLWHQTALAGDRLRAAQQD